MKEFYIALSFLALVLFAGMVFEAPSESFYKEGVQVWCQRGDLCR